MLQQTIQAEEYETLGDLAKQLYGADGSDYKLDEAFLTDNSGLTSTLSKLKGDLSSNTDSLLTANTEIDELKLKLAKSRGNQKEVDKLTQDKLDAAKTAHDQELLDAKETIHNLTVGVLRDSIANEVFINPMAWKMTDLEARIKLNDDGKTYLTNKLGETITRDQFIKELRDDESLAFSIKGISGKGSVETETAITTLSPNAIKGYSDMTKSEQTDVIAKKYKL